jgi:cytochrome c oxidase subunit I+III
VTVVDEPALRHVERLERTWEERPGLLGWLTTTDHKRIGILYLFATLAFFAAGGVEALLIRTQLARPDEHVVGPGTYDQLFTLHGVTMIFLFVIPLTTGAFGNYLVPLMIGARDMAFPRLNALSFWLFLGSGIFIYTSLAIGKAPDAGWFNYVPLALKPYSSGPNIDFYGLGLIFNGISTSIAAINFVTTIFKLRTPGMSLNRMPLFCFAILATALALIFALPALTLDCIFLELQRNLGFHFFDVAHGGDPLLWQHLFWIFGHPEVYIIVLPAFGIATSIIPTFARRRMLAFPLVALAELLVAFIGFGVWAHHMFTTGLPTATLIVFAAASMMVVIPSTIQIFAWTFTVVTGTPRFRAPLLFIGAFIVFFVIGGLSGIMFAAIPFDQATTDTYFVVAHFHFIIFGAAVFPLLGGLYYWFPKVTGRLYHEGWAKVSFWLAFWGTAITFFPMHIVGLLGMPRRVYTYQSGLGWGSSNLIETLGSYVLALGLVVIAVNLAWSRFRGAPSGADPFNGGTLEWATTSPPPPYNFAVVPQVTSPYPNWDEADRRADLRRLREGELVLDDGHETPASTVVDAKADEVLRMPAESPWPIVVAVFAALGFAALLLGHYAVAGIFALALLVPLAAWHAAEPDDPRPAPETARPAGWWGMALFVALEATLFATILGTYIYLRFQASSWPPPGIPTPKVLVPLLLAGLLVLTSLPVQRAVSWAQLGRIGAARGALAVALAIQTVWLGLQLHLFLDDLDRFTPSGSAYASIYYVLVGAHMAHVVVGILISLWLVLRLASGPTRYRLVGLRANAFYWHFVNVLAVIVTLVQISPSL